MPGGQRTSTAWITLSSNLERLTSAGGPDLFAAWSPDGSRIAFASQRDGDINLYTMNADGSDQTRLTQGAERDTSPVWSPDGAMIAFSRASNSSSDDWRVFIVPAIGGAATLVPDSDGLLVSDWSSDGTTLLADGMWTISVEGEGRTRLRDGVAARWSPDGSQIVFAGETSAGVELFVMGADGSDPVQITDGDGAARWPSWSPDGYSISYHRDGFGANGVFVAYRDGSGERRVDQLNGLHRFVSWGTPN